MDGKMCIYIFMFACKNPIDILMHISNFTLIGFFVESDKYDKMIFQVNYKFKSFLSFIEMVISEAWNDFGTVNKLLSRSLSSQANLNLISVSKRQLADIYSNIWNR